MTDVAPREAFFRTELGRSGQGVNLPSHLSRLSCTFGESARDIRVYICTRSRSVIDSVSCSNLVGYTSSSSLIPPENVRKKKEKENTEQNLPTYTVAVSFSFQEPISHSACPFGRGGGAQLRLTRKNLASLSHLQFQMLLVEKAHVSSRFTSRK